MTRLAWRDSRRRPNSPAVTTARNVKPAAASSFADYVSKATHNREAFDRMLRARRMPKGSSRCASLR